jgi:hypothetical protein
LFGFGTYLNVVVEQIVAARREAGIHNIDTRVLVKPNVDRRGVAVVEFMREVGDEKDAQPMRRIKWFLVGRGEAGKTSLFRALQNPSTAKLTDKLDRTVLIDVHEVRSLPSSLYMYRFLGFTLAPCDLPTEVVNFATHNTVNYSNTFAQLVSSKNHVL